MKTLEQEMKKLEEEYTEKKRQLEIEVEVHGKLKAEPRHICVHSKPYDGIPVSISYGDYNNPFNPIEIMKVLEGFEIPELCAIDYEGRYYAFVPPICFSYFTNIDGETRVLPFKLVYAFDRLEMKVIAWVGSHLCKFEFDLGPCFQFGRCTSTGKVEYHGGPYVYRNKSFQVNHATAGVLTVDGEPVAEIQPYRGYWTSPEEKGRFEFWYCPYHEEGTYTALQYINSFTNAITRKD